MPVSGRPVLTAGAIGRKVSSCCAPCRLLVDHRVSPLRNHHICLTTYGSWSAFVSTYTPKPGEIARNWHVIDAEDVILGRLATQVATLLRGKHKATFAPHVDGGDFVVVVNASKIALSGNKRSDSMRYSHTGTPGGLRSVSIGDLLAKDPRKAVEKAVWGMLPKNKLSRQLISKLKVYSGSEHPHAAQKPQPFEITQIAQ